MKTQKEDPVRRREKPAVYKPRTKVPEKSDPADTMILAFWSPAP